MIMLGFPSLFYGKCGFINWMHCENFALNGKFGLPFQPTGTPLERSCWWLSCSHSERTSEVSSVIQVSRNFFFVMFSSDEWLNCKLFAEWLWERWDLQQTRMATATRTWQNRRSNGQNKSLGFSSQPPNVPTHV